MKASETLLQILKGMEAAAAKLSAPPLGSMQRFAADYLILNGLHVAAFVCLEEYLRKRCSEVFRGLFAAPATFVTLPDSLQLQLLQEWVRGTSTFIQRKDVSGSKTAALLMEAECLGSLVAAAPPVVSDFFFGRSQSNISMQQIADLLLALKLKGGWDALEEISRRSGLTHLGKPSEIFGRTAEVRHAAAHGFELDFKLAEFQTAVRVSLRLLAFTFDTCISQAAFSIRKAITQNLEFEEISPENFPLRIVRFDSLKTQWDIQFNGAGIGVWTKGQYAGKLEKLRAQALISGESTLVTDASGDLIDWIQPI